MGITKSKIDKDVEKADQQELYGADADKQIICPLTLEATARYNEKPLAVNYTANFEPTISLTDDDGNVTVGVYYSSPKGRNHEGVFLKMLEEKKRAGLIEWDESGFYFTHEEGVKAREAYEQMVLAGKTTIDLGEGEEKEIPVKGNAKSWGNKHAGYTGVSWDELRDMHPDLYKPSAQKKDEPTDEDALAAEAAVEEAEGEGPRNVLDIGMDEDGDIPPEELQDIRDDMDKEAGLEDDEMADAPAMEDEAELADDENEKDEFEEVEGDREQHEIQG